MRLLQLFNNLLPVFKKIFLKSTDLSGVSSDENQNILSDLSDKSYWIILRCSKCDHKSIPIVNKGIVNPASRYCRHCGSEKFYLQKREDIERLDTIYALYSKDLYSIRQGMVRHNTVTLDSSFDRTYVSQDTYNVWNRTDIDFVGNVISLDKYLAKNK